LWIQLFDRREERMSIGPEHGKRRLHYPPDLRIVDFRGYSRHHALATRSKTLVIGNLSRKFWICVTQLPQSIADDADLARDREFNLSFRS
jgi:hypothetical protein